MDGHKLAALRQQAGISQVHLAKLADLDPSAIGKLERGHQVNPKLSTLLALAAALGCRVADFAPEVLEVQTEMGEAEATS